jgi:hypothetical protein
MGAKGMKLANVGSGLAALGLGVMSCLVNMMMNV